ncbi:MAG: adenylate/guanylate cyclase domain-containing protein [Proteobacteria bacterium]|nr:adenylate/guanylate cyclase domain-containing protein [Pseudomonadota bacterium]
MIRAGAALFILLLAAGINHSEWLRPLDLKLLDAQFRVLRTYALRPAVNPVVVVGFDEETATALLQPFTLWHPHLGKFLQAAAGAGATVIGLDVVLPDRSFETIVPGYDRQLLTGILIARRTTPVVLALTVDPVGVTRPVYPAFLTVAGKDSTGYALLPIDADGVVRRFDESIRTDNSDAPTLVGQMARKLGKPVQEGLIDFAAGEPFDFVPLQSVLQWYDAGNTAELERAFRGKAVLLGSTLKFEDRLAAPVNLVGWDVHATNAPGVLLHAQALRNLLNDGVIQPAAPWLPLVLALAAALLWLWAPPPAVAFAVIVFLWAGCIGASTLALAKGLELPVANVMLIALIAVGGRQLWETVLNLRERRRLRRSFGGYVSPAVMRGILAGTLNPSLGGTKQFACVLFSDIRGYTTRSERMTPEQTIAFLNNYFDRIVPIIHDHGGTVVSFMGDGIMAVFGVPQPTPNPCAAAFDATRAMLDSLRKLNAGLAAKGEIPLEIGVGLHAGEGVAGHIGAATRHEYSVIGDVTNVASRLEGLTKEVGYHLVCSHAVVDRLENRDGLVPLGARPIKGHSALEVFGYDRITPAAAPR